MGLWDSISDWWDDHFGSEWEECSDAETLSYGDAPPDSDLEDYDAQDMADYVEELKSSGADEDGPVLGPFGPDEDDADDVRNYW